MPLKEAYSAWPANAKVDIHTIYIDEEATSFEYCNRHISDLDHYDRARSRVCLLMKSVLAQQCTSSHARHRRVDTLSSFRRSTSPFDLCANETLVTVQWRDVDEVIVENGILQSQ
ncbi:hypothetical protein LSAT2_021184 [Lamellibrachia satsuma]|nr:hypothetical protein LSAT2_021184 [Lamellibrachia satsuma]